MNDDSNMDTILDELSSFEFPVKSSRDRVTVSKLTEDNAADFVLKSAEALINAGLDTVADLRDYVVQGQNPEEIDALASLINSTTGAIETLNKFVLLKKKNEFTKEIKILEMQNRKEVAQLLPSGVVNTTNVVIASREEMMQQLLNVTERDGDDLSIDADIVTIQDASDNIDNIYDESGLNENI